MKKVLLLPCAPALYRSNKLSDDFVILNFYYETNHVIFVWLFGAEQNFSQVIFFEVYHGICSKNNNKNLPFGACLTHVPYLLRVYYNFFSLHLFCFESPKAPDVHFIHIWQFYNYSAIKNQIIYSCNRCKLWFTYVIKFT